MASFLRRFSKRRKSKTRFIPTKIICHHSLTSDSGTASWGAIRRYHIDTLGWSDCGYHAGCEMVMSGNEIHHEVLMGRMWDKQGAHTKGENYRSLGICFIGNHDKTLPSIQALKAGAKVIALWLKIYKLSVDDIYPHSDFSDKSCPGKLFDMELLKKYVRHYKEG